MTAFTRSTVPMMLAPGWRLTTTTIAGWPLTRAEVVDVGHAVDDVGDVRQAHGEPVAVGDHQGCVDRPR